MIFMRLDCRSRLRAARLLRDNDDVIKERP